MASNPIFRKTLTELWQMIDEDVRFLESDYPMYDINGKKKNVYKAREYANKLRDFLTLNYFKDKTYRYVADIFGNLKYWTDSTNQDIEKNKKKIIEIKSIKRLKGQISIFDDVSSLTQEELKRACCEPDVFIKELKELNSKLEKDNKLGRFCLAYLMNHNQLLRGIYE